MLKIRLQRVGRRHQPSFRIVVIESTKGPKSGGFVEILGSYDPTQKERTQIKSERVEYWISNGAKLSGTVHNLLITQGVIKGEKVNVLPRKTPLVTEAPDEKKEDVKIEEKASETSEGVADEESSASEDVAGGKETEGEVSENGELETGSEKDAEEGEPAGEIESGKTETEAEEGSDTTKEEGSDTTKDEPDEVAKKASEK